MKITSHAHQKLLTHASFILLGISLYFLLATLFVTSYRFDNSLSLCACKPTTYRPTSFILKTLLYKERVYAINKVGCSGVNSCLPNSFIFPIDLLTLGIGFGVLFLIINEERKRSHKRNNKQQNPVTPKHSTIKAKDEKKNQTHKQKETKGKRKAVSKKTLKEKTSTKTKKTHRTKRKATKKAK